VLVPTIGLIGAALATIFSYLIMFCMTAYYCWPIEINLRYIKTGRIILAAILMGVALSFIQPDTIFNKLIAVGAGALIYLALLLLFQVFSKKEKEEIKKLIRF
jgi:O-antigen/teichoic acid export membrane protein